MTIDEWIILGETGTSSKTMWAALKGISIDGKMKGYPFDVPGDGADFRRCYNFVEQCNITKEQLTQIKEACPWWAPFIDNWDTLCKMYEESTPMYEFISKLYEESKILAGWVKVGNGCWTYKEIKE